MRYARPSAFVVLFYVSVTTSALAQSTAQSNVETAWYTPTELLTALAQRDCIRWALPETLAGRALVGEAATDALLDAACKQWSLDWTRSNGIIVVHRARYERLQLLTAALEKGDRAAAWELGWFRDGRALPALAGALASKDAALALAAAQAIEILDTMVPLGQDERVDEVPAGRVSLGAAFPPRVDLALLDSPYPPVRAAALRLLLGASGKAADQPKGRLGREVFDSPSHSTWQMWPLRAEHENSTAVAPVVDACSA